MKRGDVWLAEVGGKKRPVLVLTRSAVIDVRALVTVAEITTSIRGTAVEVPLDAEDLDLNHPSVVNCDGLHTIRQASLTRHVGAVSARSMHDICVAARYAIGC